jgi:tetratricopeptide (TPR) repeat protein
MLPLRTARIATTVDDLDAARKDLVVEVLAGGRLVARWSAADQIDGNPDFVPAAGKKPPPPKPRDQMTVEELFLAGVEEEKDGQENAAADTYTEVLAREPGYVPALLKQAWRSYRAANFVQAESFIARALARNASDPAIHYAAGVVYRASQRWGLAQESLWSAIHYGGPPAPAFAQLGEIAIHQKRYEEAVKLLRQSLSFNPDDALVLSDLAVALRLAGKAGEAAKATSLALEKMPLLPFALAERWRLSPPAAGGPATSTAGSEWKKILGYDVQNYLEVAAWYRRLGDAESVNFILTAALKDLPSNSLSPLVYYYLASNARQEGKTGEAEQRGQQGASARHEKVFPHRLEDALVLDQATRENPTDAHACYFLGNFLFALGRYEAASRLWFQALGLGFEDSVLYRNLGVHAWRVKKDLQGAAGFFEKAIELAPNEYRLYVDLDDIYAQSGDTPRREKLLAKAPAEVLGRDTVRVRRALFHLQLRQYDQALEMLREHRFKPYEGGEVVRQVYVASNLEKGRASFAAGKFREAEESFRQATEYPENLGVGKPNEPHDEAAYYWLGEALRAAGDPEGAFRAWEEVAKAGRHTPLPSKAYQPAALAKLGRSNEGQRILTDIFAAASGQEPDATALYAAGIAEALVGGTERAAHDFRRALEIDPAFWPARIELER